MEPIEDKFSAITITTTAESGKYSLWSKLRLEIPSVETGRDARAYISDRFDSPFILETQDAQNLAARIEYEKTQHPDFSTVSVSVKPLSASDIYQTLTILMDRVSDLEEKMRKQATYGKLPNEMKPYSSAGMSEF